MICIFLKNLWVYITHKRYLKAVYKEEHIIENLSKILNVNLKIDWLGRLYCVVNPLLIKNNNDSISGFINQNDQSFFIRNWLIEKLNISNRYIVNNNLFELLGVDIKKIDDNQNYLLTIYPISLLSIKQNFKYVLVEIVLLIMLLLIFFIFL